MYKFRAKSWFFDGSVLDVAAFRIWVESNGGHLNRFDGRFVIVKDEPYHEAEVRAGEYVAFHNQTFVVYTAEELERAV